MYIVGYFLMAVAKPEGMLKGILGKLGNESFVAKAPKEIVDRELEKKADLEQKLEKLNQNLSGLG